MIKIRTLLAVGIASFMMISLNAQAQTPPGGGTAATPGYGMGQGGGGMGPGGGRGFRFDNSNTRGWALMTPEERAAHRNKMLSAKTYEECKAIQEAHHKTMVERAKEQGKTLPAPRQNGCDRMKARGMLQ